MGWQDTCNIPRRNGMWKDFVYGCSGKTKSSNVFGAQGSWKKMPKLSELLLTEELFFFP